MKYVISWRERPAASTKEYEAAQDRVMQIFKDWKFPASFTIHQFVLRAGDFGGYIIADITNADDIHYFTTVYAAFEFEVVPVVDIMDGVAAQAKAIEYRKKNA